MSPARRRMYFIATLVFCFALPLLYNACGPGFQVSNQSSSLPINVLAANGAIIYKVNCVRCHGELSAFSHKNSSAQKIRDAVNGVVPTMGFLKTVLKPADYDALAEAIKSTSTVVAKQCTTSTDYAKTTVRRLNAREHLKSVRDLLQDPALTVSGYPQDAVTSGFDTDQEAVRTFKEDAPKLLEITEALVSQLKAKNASVLNSCNTQGGGSATTKNATQVTCAKTLISRLARKAFKKVPTTTEIQPLNAMIDAAPGVQEGVGLAVSSILMAPQFLFHVVDYSVNRVGSIHTLNAFELAARMSYFIWGTLPDDQLLDLAQSNQLLTPSVLSAQVKRMLDDPKSGDFITLFSQQWLSLSRIEAAVRAPETYPEFSQALRSSMVKETTALFKDTFDRTLPVDTVLTANYSFMDKTLADFYGIPFTGQNSTSFVSHTLSAGSSRRGFLSHAAIMTLTSTETATSPVKRGHYLLDLILCDKQDDPPAGTNTDISAIDPNLPIKERLRIHRSSPDCARCHQKMDPIGFAYENFDPIGRYRTTYKLPNGSQIPIDSSGEMPDGFKFANGVEVPPWFAAGDKFEICVNKQLSSFALGRMFSDGDRCAAEKTAETLTKTNPSPTFDALVENLVLSDFFKKSKVP